MPTWIFHVCTFSIISNQKTKQQHLFHPLSSLSKRKFLLSSPTRLSKLLSSVVQTLILIDGLRNKQITFVCWKVTAGSHHVIDETAQKLLILCINCYYVTFPNSSAHSHVNIFPFQRKREKKKKNFPLFFERWSVHVAIKAFRAFLHPQALSVANISWFNLIEPHENLIKKMNIKKNKYLKKEKVLWGIGKCTTTFIAKSLLLEV